eukprot:TRINITY_DN431_c0_g1_i7.p2 TRINITY_DN431_c0_g1~~TRINITY_DN431_c0_g1_i7.p2  ORF type:complete len:166 (-),score=2.29 TRINITY_DN431_c0_g1_i7:21-518(-)
MWPRHRSGLEPFAADVALNLLSMRSGSVLVTGSLRVEGSAAPGLVAFVRRHCEQTNFPRSSPSPRRRYGATLMISNCSVLPASLSVHRRERKNRKRGTARKGEKRGRRAECRKRALTYGVDQLLWKPCMWDRKDLIEMLEFEPSRLSRQRSNTNAQPTTGHVTLV